MLSHIQKEAGMIMQFDLQKWTNSELMPIYFILDRISLFEVDRNILHIFDKNYTYYFDLNSKQEWKEEHSQIALDQVVLEFHDHAIKHGGKQYW